jgi:hypothetical protein
MACTHPYFPWRFCPPLAIVSTGPGDRSSFGVSRETFPKRRSKFEKRKQIMTAWASFAASSNVVAMKAA